MRINTNLGALTAANNLTKVNDQVRASAEKLSSGFRINKASDDAAGLGVANSFRSDIRSLTQAQRNAEQASSVFAIAEGGASSIQKILERMKELAAQSASDSVDTEGRKNIQAEFKGLQNEIDRVTTTTEFQGKTLLDGTYGAKTTGTVKVPGTAVGYSSAVGTTLQAVTISVGAANVVTATNGTVSETVTWANYAKAQSVSFKSLGITINTSDAVADLTALTAAINGAVITTAASKGTFLIGAARNVADYSAVASNALQIDGAGLALTTTALKVSDTTVGASVLIDVLSLAGAQNSLTKIDSALLTLNSALGTIGAGQNRISNAVDNLKSTILNYQAAESTIRDLDMASEMVSFSKNQILAQAGTAMLAQANQSGQGILKLLQ